MVIAKFLDEKLLEPKKQQLRREFAETYKEGYLTGLADGRAEAVAQVRSWLLESGIHLDQHISSAELHVWLTSPRQRRNSSDLNSTTQTRQQ